MTAQDVANKMIVKILGMCRRPVRLQDWFRHNCKAALGTKISPSLKNDALGIFLAYFHRRQS